MIKCPNLNVSDYLNKMASDSVRHLTFGAMMTAMVERSLGNLLETVYGSDIHIPALLRDLLRKPELVELLNSDLLFLLRTLMGSPKSLNIRNIIWHGFCTIDTIKPYHCSFLIVTAFSIGKTLKVSTVTKRNSICLSPVMKIRSNVKYHIEYQDLNDSQDPLMKRFVTTQKPLLKKSVDFYKDESFVDCLAILIPLWESVCRCAYVTSNNLTEERLITAESSEFYITFDTMLKKEIANGIPNEFIAKIGAKHVEYLLDLLTMPLGPRIRDKISHGEVDLFQEEPEHLKAVCELILISMGDFITDSSSFDHYVPQHHPVAVLKEKLTLVRQNLIDLLETCLKPGPIDEDGEFWIEAVSPMDMLITMEFQEGCTLFRSKVEYEILNLDLKIVEKIDEAIKNIGENLTTSKKKFLGNTLRSRQRATLKKMLEACPKVCSAFVLLFSSISTDINSFMGQNLDQTKAKLKKEKRALKLCENLATYVKVGKNRWDEAIKLINSELLCTLEHVQ